MSFNRRGPDRRPDRPSGRDRHERPGGRGDWQPREQRGGDRPGYPPRDRPPGDRPPYPPRGGDRPFTPRPRQDRPPDEGAMSIRLDPRRVNALKHLAGEAGLRPGDLVRQWVEERIDAARTGGAVPSAPGAESLLARVDTLAARVTALEAAAATAEVAPVKHDAEQETPRKRRAGASKRASATPPGERVALHDEMIAVIGERGPMSAADLASAITERGRYAPPRSGKPIDAAMVSQRVSNPTYRARFRREGGRIGLVESS